MVSKSFGKSAKRRHSVIDQIRIQQLPVFIDHFLDQPMADGVHDPAFVLAFAQNRMNRLANVGQRNILEELNLAGVAIDFDLGGAPSDFPKIRRRTERRFWTLDRSDRRRDRPFRRTLTRKLSASARQSTGFASWRRRFCRRLAKLFGFGFENFGGMADNCRFKSCAARCTDKPITTIELLALVLTS